MHAINNCDYNTMYYNLSSSPIPSSHTNYSLSSNESFSSSSYPMNFNSNFNAYTYSSPIVPSYYYKPTMPYDYSSTRHNVESQIEYNDSNSSSYSYFPSNCFYTPSSSSSSSSSSSTAPLSRNSTSDLNSHYQLSLLSVSK